MIFKPLSFHTTEIESVYVNGLGTNYTYKNNQSLEHNHCFDS